MYTHMRGLLTTVVALAVVAIGGAAPAAQPTETPARELAAPVHRGLPIVVNRALPAFLNGGAWKSGHLQGLALDRRKGHVYYSFTNMLVKTDLRGKPLGSVTGFTGHLGDVDFNAADGRVYGSLEYATTKAYYISIFNGDRITRMNMDAQSSGVVSTVHLKEVVRDYTADMNGDGVFDGDTAKTPDHRYGCSGIDGVAFGPEFGSSPGQQKLTVAYGLYSHTTRKDNDHQVLLQYDVRNWKKYERPLTEKDPHRYGPGAPDGKYFVYTGNTTYGVQNLEYDGHSGNWLMAVYKGKKSGFPNYSLFVVDGKKRPVTGAIRGQQRPERGRLLSLLRKGLHHTPSGTYGWRSGGQYGLVSLDDGRFYLGEAGKIKDGTGTKETGKAVLHRWTGKAPTPFTKAAQSSR
ncbi:hypothetical protein OG883_10525 [Streptomyces sp. NBC_01142]|uniref:hypothetical protein n=1 Tax=Streptomyces sp. NBC_01142 TaxID=2975865 RepID=UPI002250C5EA|nr:hypothetical protein [Streptomyces sp. NBC_01142]MCX4820334.1 hypothetical protein [Streptomyces sp. NBC_01142]